MDHEDHNHHQNHSQHKSHKPAVVRNMKHKEHQHKGGKHDAAHENMHDKHAGHHTGDFLKRFWIFLFLTPGGPKINKNRLPLKLLKINWLVIQIM